MSVLDTLSGFALAGLPVGLFLGMALGPVAHRPDGGGGYASLSRRAARLGHVASVMLPLIAGFYALAAGAGSWDAALLAWAVPLWIGGAVVLVAVLFATAFRPGLRVVLPVPATALAAASVLFALGIRLPGV
ncbi:MAG: hypothetical protein ACYTG6_12245 [Planctomycetota bacterium]|jgi:hypothetical protein